MNIPNSPLIGGTSSLRTARLNEVEIELGLPRTDMAQMPWVRRLKRHSRPRGAFTDVAGVVTRRMSKEAARRGPWPPYEAFVTPETQERIALLYKADIETYHFASPSTGTPCKPG